MNPTRAGTLVRQPGGYAAFIPKPLPPDPPIRIDSELLELLSKADRALGRLDGATEILPNPDLFIAMYVRQEAVLSSQIEGTQASLVDLLAFELDSNTKRQMPPDVEEVVNYVKAMNYGLRRLETLPLSLRLIREIHEALLKDSRGGERNPGEFRRTQNWIGPPGGTLRDAVFVPPPVPEMTEALDDFERFLRSEDPMPALIMCALAHVQFETIHPFLDGNGRLGRLLITFMLCERGILRRPLLYLSLFFKQNRQEYYDRLMAVRTQGDFEGWIKFFLRGVAEVSAQATDTARAILALREQHRGVLSSSGWATPSSLTLLEHLYEHPMLTVSKAAELLGVTFPTANNIVGQFSSLGLLEEVTGRQRRRLFAYRPYLEIFHHAGVDFETAFSLAELS